MSENVSDEESKFQFVFDSTSSIHVNLIIDMRRVPNPEKLRAILPQDDKIVPIVMELFNSLTDEQQSTIMTIVGLYFEKVRLEASHQDTRQIDEMIRWLKQNTEGFNDSDLDL